MIGNPNRFVCVVAKMGGGETSKSYGWTPVECVGYRQRTITKSGCAREEQAGGQKVRGRNVFYFASYFYFISLTIFGVTSSNRITP